MKERGRSKGNRGKGKGLRGEGKGEASWARGRGRMRKRKGKGRIRRGRARAGGVCWIMAINKQRINRSVQNTGRDFLVAFRGQCQ